MRNTLKFFLVAFLIAGTVTVAFVYFTFTGEDDAQVHVPEVSFDDTQNPSEQNDEEQEEDAEKDAEEDVVEDDEEDVEEEIPAVDSDEDTENSETLPSEYNLAVPFTPQAPHADWSLPYQEACEEASLYMVHAYYSGVSSGKIDPDVADAELKSLVAFQEDFFGYYLDTTAAETGQIMDMYYGRGARVVDDPTVEMIKAEIAAGRPVILFAAGRQLGNPNFSGEGPLYHVLVIKGYTETQFITNDPGTRNGENYVYAIDTIMSAMGDWNHGDPANGAKRVLFTSP